MNNKDINININQPLFQSSEAKETIGKNKGIEKIDQKTSEIAASQFSNSANNNRISSPNIRLSNDSVVNETMDFYSETLRREDEKSKGTTPLHQVTDRKIETVAKSSLSTSENFSSSATENPNDFYSENLRAVPEKKVMNVNEVRASQSPSEIITDSYSETLRKTEDLTQVSDKSDKSKNYLYIETTKESNEENIPLRERIEPPAIKYTAPVRIEQTLISSDQLFKLFKEHFAIAKIEQSETHHLYPITLYSYQIRDSLEPITKKMENLMDKMTDDVMTFIKSQGIDYLIKAKNSGIRQSIIVNNTLLGFTPSGKIYLGVEQLGTGNFKETFSTVLIASTQIEKIQQGLVHRAFSITKTQEAGSSTPSSLENEIRVHLYLKQKSRTHDLSNVCAAKSVSVMNQKKIGIMTELCEGGDLDSLLKSNRVISQAETYFLAAQMATGLAQLHHEDVNIVHRDLKSDNFFFLLDEKGQIEKVKIGDFGLSSQCKDNLFHSSIFPFCFVDPQWHDYPEYKGAPQFSKESDVYQLGVTFYQMFVDLPLQSLYKYFSESTLKLQSKSDRPVREFMKQFKLSYRNWLGMNKIQDLEVREFLFLMLDPDPSKRPTAQAVANFFNRKFLANKIK